MNDESREFHREADLAEKRDEHYQDWKKDNLDELKRNFLEDNDDFDKYCRDEFKNKDK